ncbi:hypothetical protein C7H52_10795, partial [Aurantibacter aestuarii]
MIKKILFLLALVLTNYSFAQTYTMGDVTTGSGVQTTCSGTFVDSGGAGGNYSAGESFEVTFCPSTPGNYIQFDFSSFNVEGEPFDFLTFYEGIGTGGTVIGVYGDNDPPDIGACAGGTFIASSDPSGCITVVFESDSSVQLDGWEATISCTTTPGGDTIPGGVTPPANSVCGGSGAFCADAGALEFPNTTDADCVPDAPAEVVTNSCLGSAPNPAWYFIEVGTSGDIIVEIEQTTGPGGTGTGLDVDFAVWGPFTQPSDACLDFTANTPIDCSYSFAAIETADIIGAQAGEFYMFLVTNFDGDEGFITLTQTNSGNPGAGTTDCCPVISAIEPSVCGASDGAIYIELLQPNTAYTITYNDPAPQSYSGTSDANGILTIPNLPAGNYTTVDTGTAGCTPRDIVISDPASGTFNGVTSNGTICAGQNAVFDLSGPPNAIVSYNINGGATQTVTLDASGNATVTVTAPITDQTINVISMDEGGCVSALSVSETVIVSPGPTADASAVASPICDDGTNAQFIITGTPNATVEYNINGGATQTITLDASGNATVTVTSPVTNQTINLTQVSIVGAPIVGNGLSGSGAINSANASGPILPIGSTLDATNSAQIANGADTTLTLVLEDIVPVGTSIILSVAQDIAAGDMTISDGVNTINFNTGPIDVSQQINFVTGVATNTLTFNRLAGRLWIDGVEYTLPVSSCTVPLTDSETVIVNTTPTADAPADVTACDSYVLPALSAGNTYYTGSGGTGTVIASGTSITTTQTIYVYAETGTTPNCTDENSFVVTINATPTADAPADVTACDSYVLPALNAGNTYYTGSGGTGTVIASGTSITTTQTIYVYAESGTTPNCTDENSFVVTINTT